MKNSTSRYLILGSDERLWNFNSPVIFLGDWCRLYKRRKVWSSMDFIVAEPFGELSERSGLYDNARQLEKEIFPTLCDLLNDYHDTQYSHRFWKIVLGLWFHRYVDVIYNRVETFDKCLNDYNISGLSIIESSSYDFSTKDSLSAIWSFNDDQWNNMLYSRIVGIVKPSVDFPINIVSFEGDETCFIFKKTKNVRKKFYKKITNKILEYGNFLMCNFSTKDNVFIINSYLPKVMEMKLHLMFGNFPKIWKSDNHIVSKNPNIAVRKSLTSRMSFSCTSNVKLVAQKMLFEVIPVCYLEGFNELLDAAKLRGWPNTPKFIFTSNNYDTDEVFKVWTALKVENGSNYIIGQHGNLSRIGSQAQYIIDNRVANKFISWGWSDHERQVFSGFIFKTPKKDLKQINSASKILMILCHYPHRINVWDESIAHINTFQNHMEFIKILPIELKGLLTIRLHSEWKNFNFDERERLKIFEKQVNIESGSESLDKLIENSRIVIHGYDTTGILETLAMNLPTLAFWSGGLDHLRGDARPYYELLVQCGIIHFTPCSLSGKVQDVYHDVYSWWYSEDVQLARKTFCNQYANMSSTPILDLNHLIDEDK